MNAPVRLRPEIAALPAYRQGKQAAPDAFKLSSNENPFEPLPAVVDALRDAVAVNRYPDATAAGLRAALADKFGVTTDEVHVGAGSVSLLQQLVLAAAAPGDEVVYAWRSFEAYPIAVTTAGAASVQVPVTAEGRHDLPAMLAAITERTKIVMVCTPNNPTGPAVTQAELDDFIAAVPDHVVVVVDEAYLEFVRMDDAVDGLATYRAHPNVVLFRTFSKAYGLAGFRVGYAVAQGPVAAALRAVSLPFGVSAVAQAAAIASLEAEDELLERVEALALERARVHAALLEMGWSIPEPQGNFVWFGLGERTADFALAADEAGIVVRPFAGEGARVSIGETEGNDRLLEVARAFGVS